MRKKKIAILVCTLLSLFTFASCGGNSTSQNDSNQVGTVIRHHLVSFYVEDTLYKTARVPEGDTLKKVIDDPSKEGYDFIGWKYQDGTDFVFEETVINKATSLYATFKKKVVVTPPVENDINVEDVKDPTKEYSLVIGWYGKTDTSGLDVDVMKVFANNLVSYLNKENLSKDEIAKISIRRYCTMEGDNKVADMGNLVNADGDVDILLGVGGNIDSVGNVAIISKDGNITMGGKQRYIAKLTDKELVNKVYGFIIESNTENSMFLDTFTIPSTTL